jgi:hypothetical protein
VPTGADRRLPSTSRAARSSSVLRSTTHDCALKLDGVIADGERASHGGRLLRRELSRVALPRVNDDLDNTARGAPRRDAQAGVGLRVVWADCQKIPSRPPRSVVKTNWDRSLAPARGPSRWQRRAARWTARQPLRARRRPPAILQRDGSTPSTSLARRLWPSAQLARSQRHRDHERQHRIRPRSPRHLNTATIQSSRSNDRPHAMNIQRTRPRSSITPAALPSPSIEVSFGCLSDAPLHQ